MSEELEVCFKRIKNLQVCVDYEKDIVKSVDEILPNSCNKVEQALQRLESIDNSEPSEALKGLKHIKKYYVPQPCTVTTANYLEIIEQALIKAQEDKR